MPMMHHSHSTDPHRDPVRLANVRRLGIGLLLMFLSGWASALGAIEPVIEAAAFGVAPVLDRPVMRADASANEAPSVRVMRDESWPALLKRLVPDRVEQARLLSALPGAALPALRPGRFLRLNRSDPQGASLSIDYLYDARTAFGIRMEGGRLHVTERLPSDDLRRAVQQDELKSSLFAATDAVGLPESIALQLADIFAEQVDFLRDLRQGYRCAIVYEMNYADGMPRPGRILAAEFSRDGRQSLAYFHRFRNGETGYFDGEGSDVNRVLRPDTPASGKTRAEKAHAVDAATSFRRSPLEFSRITSAPAKLRFHPILKQWRAHRGTDYGAPVGTQVKATADGEVFFIGTRGSYGNLIILRHYGRFTTFYGHLNGFASGLAFGGKVRKGEVIGYVGMTGLATGPHLHYELRDDRAPDVFDTPLVVRSIGEDEAPEFRARTTTLRQQLDHAYRANQVMLE
jgi:murein DD-endopeptidase MepM/ murein hydrolase activator NlpD